MTRVDELEAELHALADPSQVEKISKRVARDQIIGVRMKHTFDLAKANRDLDLDLIRDLLRSHWYELRMVGVSILDARARRHPPSTPERTALYEIYLAEHDGIDTWDLVDRAAPRVIGEYLLDRSREPLHELSHSATVWERRTSIVACYWIIRHGTPQDPLAILEALADDPEPFVQAALGTAVRELRRHHPQSAASYEATHTLSAPARRAAGVGRS